MDNYLSNEFGNLGLSSKAREWRPPGVQQQPQQQQPRFYRQQQQQPPKEQRREQKPLTHAARPNPNEWQHQLGESELNYSVKEFVPGHGWSTQASSVSNAMNDGKKS